MKKYTTLIIGFALFAACYAHNQRQQKYIATQQTLIKPAYVTSPMAIPKEAKNTLAFKLINPS